MTGLFCETANYLKKGQAGFCEKVIYKIILGISVATEVSKLKLLQSKLKSCLKFIKFQRK